MRSYVSLAGQMGRPNGSSLFDMAQKASSQTGFPLPTKTGTLKTRVRTPERFLQIKGTLFRNQSKSRPLPGYKTFCHWKHVLTHFSSYLPQMGILAMKCSRNRQLGRLPSCRSLVGLKQLSPKASQDRDFLQPPRPKKQRVL